jgi:hypothetical protein
MGEIREAAVVKKWREAKRWSMAIVALKKPIGGIVGRFVLGARGCGVEAPGRYQLNRLAIEMTRGTAKR